MTGKKNDTGKLRYDLLDPLFQEGIVKVLTQGAQEYGDTNYINVEDHRYHAAILRHFNAYRQGELVDPDSGELHLSHVGANLMFLMVKDRQQGNSKKKEKIPSINNYRSLVYKIEFLIERELIKVLYGKTTLQLAKFKTSLRDVEGTESEVPSEELMNNPWEYLLPGQSRFDPKARLKMELKDLKKPGKGGNEELIELLTKALDKEDETVEIYSAGIVEIMDIRGKEGEKKALSREAHYQQIALQEGNGINKAIVVKGGKW